MTLQWMELKQLATASTQGVWFKAMAHNEHTTTAHELATSLTYELPPKAAGDFLYIEKPAPTDHAQSHLARIGPMSAELWKSTLEFAMSEAGQVGSQSALPGTAQGESGFYMNKDLAVAHYLLEDGDWKLGNLPLPLFPHTLASLWQHARDRHRGTNSIHTAVQAEHRDQGETQDETQTSSVAQSLDQELLESG